MVHIQTLGGDVSAPDNFWPVPTVPNGLKVDVKRTMMGQVLDFPPGDYYHLVPTGMGNYYRPIAVFEGAAMVWNHEARDFLLNQRFPELCRFHLADCLTLMTVPDPAYVAPPAALLAAAPHPVAPAPVAFTSIASAPFEPAPAAFPPVVPAPPVFPPVGPAPVSSVGDALNLGNMDDAPNDAPLADENNEWETWITPQVLESWAQEDSLAGMQWFPDEVSA